MKREDPECKLYDCITNKQGRCVCLVAVPKGQCRFMRTVEQTAAALRERERRIKSLPPVQQKHIRDTYYGSAQARYEKRRQVKQNGDK